MNNDRTFSAGPKGSKASEPDILAESSEEIPEASAPVETRTMQAIRSWVSLRVHSSPLSRNTEAYNYLMAQLPELASMIDKENQA